MLVPQKQLEELSAKNLALRMAADGVDRAEGEVLRAKDNYRNAALRRQEALKEAARGLIACWVVEQVAGMTVAEEHAFANRLGDALHTKWQPHWGSVSDEKRRMDWLRDIGVEVFGGRLDLFADPNEASVDKDAPDADKIAANRAYWLVCQHLEDALRGRYVAICGVWRADPADMYDWRKRDARENSWRIALREHPVRYVLPRVFDELQRAGRVKANGQGWAQFSKSQWSFRNGATVDVDIAKAIEAVSGEATFAKAA